MKRLTMLAALDAASGYGRTAIAFARGIEAVVSGAKVQIRPASFSERNGAEIPQDIKERVVRGVQTDEWELLLHPPNFVPTPGKKTAMFTMNESTRLTPMSVHLLNQAAVAIVPSEFCAITFSASGVTVPIRVVPLGFDPAIFRCREKAFLNGGEVVFGAAGGIAGGEHRKGLQDVLESFLRVFPKGRYPRVKLKIKCSPDVPLIYDGGDKRVSILAEHLTDAQLADWYASLSYFVSASRGEGFGLMQLEALATGRKVIGAAFGGLNDFVDDRNGHLIEYKLTPAPAPYFGHWCAIDRDDLETVMLQAAIEHTTEPYHPSMVAFSVSHLVWTSSSHKLVEVLNEFGAIADVADEFYAL